MLEKPYGAEGWLFLVVLDFSPRMAATRRRDMARPRCASVSLQGRAGFWTLVEPPQKPREMVDLYGPRPLWWHAYAVRHEGARTESVPAGEGGVRG